MEKSALLKLQNGSDIRGVALAVPDGPEVNLTEGTAACIAAAFAGWLAVRTATKAALRIGVGTDSRVTAGALKAAIMAGIASAGGCPVDCGMASTPAMFMGTVFPETAFDGAIMVTASHLPMERNGMKFFTRKGGLDKQDITENLTNAGELSISVQETNAPKSNLMELYTAYLRQKIQQGVGDERPLAGLHIVVDAGNGAGGFFASKVLEPLGADCSGSRFLEPDGTFPNHPPNPENKTAMESIRAAVLENSANLGLIFDTDVDRMSAVLEDGREVNRDEIIAMMAAIIAPSNPGGTIVTDSVTSERLTAFLQSLGLPHHCYKRGYKNVINEAVRLEGEGISAPLAIETSGHGALKENFYLDDGAYMAVKLVIAAALARKEGGKLGELIADMPPAGETAERRIKIAGEDFAAYGKEVLDTFRRRAEEKGLTLVHSFEGVRVSIPGKGWMLLRMSLHDPLLPLNAESNAPGGCKELLATAAELLAGLDRLDLSVL